MREEPRLHAKFLSFSLVAGVCIGLGLGAEKLYYWWLGKPPKILRSELYVQMFDSPAQQLKPGSYEICVWGKFEDFKSAYTCQDVVIKKMGVSVFHVPAFMVDRWEVKPKEQK